MSLKLRKTSDTRRLIEPLSTKYGLPAEVVKDVVDDLLTAIRKLVSESGRLQLRGFGVFHRKDTPAAKRRNPKTGDAVLVAARSRVVFTEEGTHRRVRATPFTTMSGNASPEQPTKRSRAKSNDTTSATTQPTALRQEEMIWTPTKPQSSGQYRWRESAQAPRVHNVRATIRKGVAVYACKTMDLRAIASGGEWSQRSTDEVAGDPLDALLQKT